MSYPLSRPMFCLFCYKNIASSSKTHTSSNNMNNFVKLLSRFSAQQELNPLIGPLNGNNLLECCNKCENVINSFCGTYTQLKILEMKLDCMLDQLVEKITCE